LVKNFTDNTHATDEKPNFYVGWDGDKSAFDGGWFLLENINWNKKIQLNLLDQLIMKLKPYQLKKGIHFSFVMPHTTP